MREAPFPPAPAPAIVRAIVGRLHVADSSRDVLRAVWRALAPDARRDPRKRPLRHQLYRQALATHEENRSLFLAIARGNLGG
jgi:hypothetical protein